MDSLPSGSITIWLRQLKEGDPGAAEPIWNAYFAKLVSVARGRLKSFPRAAADEEDVALSAFRTFCERVDAGAFPQLDDRADLWRVLFVITTRKATGLIRRETAVKRGGGHVVQAGSLDGAGDFEKGGLEQFGSGEPTPEHAAAMVDECRRLLARLGDGELSRLAIWKMEGFTSAEIAVKMGRSIPTVERKLALIRTKWERELPR